MNRSHPLSHKTYASEIRSEFCDSSYEEWLQEKEKERCILSEQKKNFNYVNSPKYKYHEYLNSPEWKAKRELVYQRDNNKCQICKTNKADNVHHLTYINLGHEDLNDLISVCRGCHKEIHNN